MKTMFKAVILMALLSTGCGVYWRLTDWTINDAESKGRSSNGGKSVTITYSRGGDGGQWIASSANDPDAPDWKAYGWADDIYANVQGTGGLQYTSRYFWNGRHHTWYPTGKKSNGNLQSDGWMDTEGLQDGAGGMRISGPYKIADWRFYANEHTGRVLEEGVYGAFRNPKDSLELQSRKHGVWRSYDHAKLVVTTETYDEGRLVSRGSEPWPDYSGVAGRYRIAFPAGNTLVANLDKHGMITVEESNNSWANGTVFWMHRSPHFNGDYTTTNFRTNGHTERWRFVKDGVEIAIFSAWNYPYEEANAVITAPRL